MNRIKKLCLPQAVPANRIINGRFLFKAAYRAVQDENAAA